MDAVKRGARGGKRRRHDNAYKGIFSNKKEFFYFLKKYIKAPWVSDVLLDSMEKVNKSFVTPDLRDVHSDVIYKQKRDGQDVYFYVLVESQSELDHTMPFRLLRYMVELLSDVFKNTDKSIRERKDFRLPAIVPIVLYNGDDNWTVVRTYREYTKDYKVFGDSVIDFRYILFDLKRMNDSDILPPQDFLDVAFFADKIFDKRRTIEDNLYETFERMDIAAPDMAVSEKRKLARWLPRVWGLPPGSYIEDYLAKSFTKGDDDMMVHPLEVAGKKLIQEGAERERIAIAKKMLAKGRSVDEVVEFTDLDLNTVLKLQY